MPSQAEAARAVIEAARAETEAEDAWTAAFEAGDAIAIEQAKHRRWEATNARRAAIRAVAVDVWEWRASAVEAEHLDSLRARLAYAQRARDDAERLTAATAAAYVAHVGGDALAAYHQLATLADDMCAVVDAARAWAAAERACFDEPLSDRVHEDADEAIDALRATVAALAAHDR